jgi:hypothetical protein
MCEESRIITMRPTQHAALSPLSRVRNLWPKASPVPGVHHPMNRRDPMACGIRALSSCSEFVRW